MKTIVTGATGFVGRRLVEELLTQGYEVVVVVRSRHKCPTEWNGKVCIAEADVTDRLAVEEHLEKFYQGDAFFHLAWSGTSGMERADVALQLKNIQAACDMVDIAAKAGCKTFVNAGSIMEYEVLHHIIKDNGQMGLGNIYSTAKLTADTMAKMIAAKSGINYINVIISNIYGAGERSERFFNSTLKKMLRNEDIPLTHGKQLYDFIYVTDAVKEIILASELGMPNESYYIGNSEPKPLKEFVLEMKETVQSKSKLDFGKVPLNGVPLDYSYFDTGRIEKLGFVPKVSFSQGIRYTADWMMGEGYAE